MFIFIQEKSFCLAVIFRADHFFLSDCCFVNLGKLIFLFILFFFVTLPHYHHYHLFSF